MKTQKYVLIIGLLLCFVFSLTGCTSADPVEYHQGDVEALQQLAEEHGWNLPEDSIAKWPHAKWSKESPKRIETLHLIGTSEPVTGTLDVSPFTGLKVLWCMDNAIDELILPDSIEELDCHRNQLTELDLTNTKSLQYLDCSGNQLKEIHYDSLPILESVNCVENQLSELNCDGLPNVRILYAWDNQLTEIDASQMLELKHLIVDGNQIAELNLDGLQRVETVGCSMTTLKHLSLKNLPKLKGLSIDDAQLETMVLENTPNLDAISCYGDLQVVCHADGFQFESFDYFNRKVTFVNPNVEVIDRETLSELPEDTVIDGNRITVTMQKVDDPSGIVIRDAKKDKLADFLTF